MAEKYVDAGLLLRYDPHASYMEDLANNDILAVPIGTTFATAMAGARICSSLVMVMCFHTKTTISIWRRIRWMAS